MLFDSRDQLFFKEANSDQKMARFCFRDSEDKILKIFSSDYDNHQLKSLQINKEKNVVFCILDGHQVGIFNCITTAKRIVELPCEDIWEILPTTDKDFLSFHNFGQIYYYDFEKHPKAFLIAEAEPRIHGVDQNPAGDQLVHVQWEEFEESNIIHLSSIKKSNTGKIMRLNKLYSFNTDFEYFSF